MSPKYWTGVFIGMLAVFGVGMLVARGIDRGKALVLDNVPASWTLFRGGLRVDGNRIGDVQRVQFMRAEPGLVDSAVLTVKTASVAAADSLEHCRLRVTSHNQTLGSDTHFYCASRQDSIDMDLVPFGHVLVLPDSHSVTLFIPRELVDRERLHAYRGTGGNAGNVDIRQSNGSLSISVNDHQLVQISGDSNGGSVMIRDANGRPLIDIHGDSTGGSIRIKDTSGKTRVDVHGTSSDSNE